MSKRLRKHSNTAIANRQEGGKSGSVRSRLQLAFHEWVKAGPSVGEERNQKLFAERIGKGQGTVQPWLVDGGRQTSPDAEVLAEIVGVLGISGHWLLTGEGPKEAPGHPVTEPYLLARLTMGAYLTDRVRQSVIEALTAIEAEGDEALRAARAAWASSRAQPPGPRRPGEGIG